MIMAGKTIVFITGGNTGLGFETCKSLFTSPKTYHILMGVRGSESRADGPIADLKASAPGTKSTVESVLIDVDSDESINNAFKQVSSIYDHIDVLINNAGVDYGTKAVRGELSTREAWLKAYNTNVVGAHIVTQTFVPLLLNSKEPTPRLIFITSGMASLTEMSEKRSPRWTAPPAGWPKPPATPNLSYRASKSGMNMMYLDWVRELTNDPVKVLCISPGFLATGLSYIGEDLLAKVGAVHPAVGGKIVKDAVEGLNDTSVGKVVDGRLGEHPFTTIQPW